MVLLNNILLNFTIYKNLPFHGCCVLIILLQYEIILHFACALFFDTDLDGREISPPCSGVSTLKPWKMLRWKMKMAKIYP